MPPEIGTTQCASRAIADAGPAEVISGLLRALVAKLGTVVEDVDEAVEELDGAFHGLLAVTDGTAAADTQTAGDRDRIMRALQFHDRLEQRIGHVCRSLNEVAELLDSHDDQLEAEHWHELAVSLRRACAIERDKQIFDAAAQMTKDPDEQPCRGTESSIELF